MEEIIDNSAESSQEDETNDEYKDRKEVKHRNHVKNPEGKTQFSHTSIDCSEKVK